MESKFVNSLIHETSVYLQQHAHNPVNWYAWGTEALNLAKQSDKPILISIGYASCHWCHVMERESFEDTETARIMNEHFVNIKIDREERPDLDQIYMEAVQILTGSGGWPLNVFLTPDGRPFYGGTYFPPERAYNKLSWKEILSSIHDAFIHRRAEVEEQAQQLKTHVEESNSFGLGNYEIISSETESISTLQDCASITEGLLKNADLVHGGFGQAPKFPQTFSLQYLLQYSFLARDTPAGDHALRSIQKMLNGGIYDQLGGGLARYSTDARWLAPHFEKMLYDNALLVILLSDAYRFSRDESYKIAIHKTLNFVMSELKNSAGGFYAAIDADSEGEEGKFYVWSKTEIEKILKEEAPMYCAYYHVEENGNWEGTNILHIQEDAKYWAEKFALTVPEFEDRIAACNHLLLQERSKRIRPITDDKIILSWNALLLKAFAFAYAATQQESYKEEAIALASFLKQTFETKEGYLRIFTKGKTQHIACLDDLAFWAEACIHLQEITGDTNYLLEAKLIMEYILLHFAHPEKPVYYYTQAVQQDLFVRKVDVFDAALPSGNAVMLKNLLYLSPVFDQVDWRIKAEAMLSSLKEIVKKHPGSFSFWASSLLSNAIGIEEIVLTGTATEASLTALLQNFFPNKVLISSYHNNEMAILQEKNFNNPVSIYVCKNNSCLAPVNTLEEMYTLIKNKTG